MYFIIIIIIINNTKFRALYISTTCVYDNIMWVVNKCVCLCVCVCVCVCVVCVFVSNEMEAQGCIVYKQNAKVLCKYK